MSTEQQTIRDFIDTARNVTAESFEKRYLHPFLLGREVLEEEFSFATAIATVDEMERGDRQTGLRIRDWVLPVQRPEGASKVGSLRVFVGRASNNDLSIPHPTVSKLHAYFTLEGSRWWIVDVGSSNGTTVNGMKAPARAKTAVYDKDVVVFGRCAFSFLLPRSLYELVASMASAIQPTD
ncbi:MAG: FHA domain-containing protein [Pseudomonadota bacterium]